MRAAARSGGARGGDRRGNLPDGGSSHKHGTGGPASPERSNKRPSCDWRRHRDHGKSVFDTGRRREWRFIVYLSNCIIIIVS